MIKLIVENSFVVTDDRGKDWEYISGDVSTFAENYMDNITRSVNESNFGRLNQHIKNGCFLISACRGDKDEKTNKKNTETLANDLRQAGLGYIRVLGGYVETRDNGEKEEVTEESFFVPLPKDYDVADFFDVAIDLCKKYNQDSVLINLPEYVEFGYYDKNGDFDFSPGDKLQFDEKHVGEYFSQLVKGTRRNQKWAFTTEWLARRHPTSVPQSVYMSQRKEIF